uniref:HEAT repeat-containing protein 3 n=1 Tax=Cacopsylla melanoneura TaxID=428564 RepID=A0A8D8MF64_9HEMI
MGKVKNGKRNKKPSPLLNQVKTEPCNPEEDEFSRLMSDIVEKLESTTVMEKLSALLLLSEMVDVKQIRTIIIEHEICKIVGPLLLDKDIQVCLNAAGAIRNLTSCGEEDVLEALVEQDVLTPILALLSNLSKTLQNPNTIDSTMEIDAAKSKKKRDSNTASMEVDGEKATKKGTTKTQMLEWEEKLDLAVQVVTTLWNLCESCATVLKYVNNEEVMNVFVSFLNVEQYDISLAIVSGQFIHMLSEDNTFVIKYLIQHESLFMAGFEKDIDPSDWNGSTLLLQVLYAGILANIQPNFFTKDSRTFEILTAILGINLRPILNQFTSDMPKSSDAAGKLKINSVANLISAQKLVLEFVTNLCSSNEDEESSSGCGGGMDVDMADEEEEAGEEMGVKLSPELTEKLTKNNILDVVLSKVELPPVNVCDILRSEDEYKHLADKLIKIQCTGFLCINNLVSCMPITADTLFIQFVNMLCHHYTDDLTVEQSESLTCALRSLVLSLNRTLQDVSEHPIPFDKHPIVLAIQQGKVGLLGNNPDETLGVLSKRLIEKLTGQQEEIKQENGAQMKNGGGDSKKIKKEVAENAKKEVNVKVEENLVKVVSTWMSIVLKMNRSNSMEHDMFVVSKLLRLLDTTTELSLLAETLDCLIDLFSDDDTDLLAKQVNLIGKLGTSEPKLKTMIKSNKKTLDSEMLALVSTVQTNLHAFIQYKRQRVNNRV